MGDPPGEVLTLEQAAEFLQFRPETVGRYAADGIIPSRKVGKEWRFSRTALEEYLGGTRKAEEGS